MKTFTPMVFACFAALFLAGCSNLTDPNRYYLYRPRLIERANPSLMAKPNVMPDVLADATDAHVLVVVNDLTNIYRGKMNVAMGVRHFSAFTQVLTAAAAAALTTLRPEERIAITVLAASSALMPQFQSIFDAKGRAAAYEQGASMLADAEAAYFTAIAASPGKLKSSRRGLTREGALLYAAALASIQVVEKLAVAQLPTIDQIKTAKGDFLADFANDTSSKAETARTVDIWMKAAATAATSSVPIAGVEPDSIAFSSAPDVVSVVARKNAVELTAHQPGDALITAVTKKDGTKRLLNVTSAVPLELKRTRFTVKRDEEFTLDASPEKIESVTFTPAGIVAVAPTKEALKATPLSQVKITAGKTLGTTVLSVVGENGGEAQATVNVVAK
jgi:hypothetical protein